MEKLSSSGEGISGGFQHKQRLIKFLNQQIEQKESAIDEKNAEVDGLKQEIEKSDEKILMVNTIYHKKFDKKIILKEFLKIKLKATESALKQKLAELEEHEKNTDKK